MSNLDPSQQEPQGQEQAPEEHQESPQEQAPSQEPEPQEQEAEAESQVAEGEADEAGGEGEEPAQAKEPEKHRRKSGYQRKIEQLERERQQLIEHVLRMGGQSPGAPPVKPKSAEEEAAANLRAMVRQEAESLVQQREEQRRQQERAVEFQREVEAARATHPDFDEVLAEVSHIRGLEHVNEAILRTKNKTEIMYSLAKSPAELARLRALSPLDAALEIGRLDVKFSSGAAQQKPRPVVRPPAPPSKVGGSATSTRDLVDLPLSEYKRARRSGRG